MAMLLAGAAYPVIRSQAPGADGLQKGQLSMACAEFLEYPAESRTLFLPRETIVAAFG